MADHETKETTPASSRPPSTLELLSSASLITDTAKSVFATHDTGSIDKVKLAGAAADLLGAAKQYGIGKVDDGSSYGKYVDQAADYLEHYSKSSPTTNSDAPPAPSDAPKEPAHEANPTPPSAAASGGGGYGDLVKLAQGFFK